jgi:hypothetical protein
MGKFYYFSLQVDKFTNPLIFHIIMNKSHKLLFYVLFTFFILTSCSTDEDESENQTNTITGTEYGYSVRGNGTDEVIAFTYKLFNKETGEIYHSGSENNGDSYNAEIFPITEKEIRGGEIGIEVKITSEITGRIENYFHVYNDQLDNQFLWILDWDQNPDAPTPFTVNRLRYNSSLDIYEGTYPTMANDEFWFLNDGTNFND